MNIPHTPPLSVLISAPLIIILPLCGIIFTGGDVLYYLHVPPATGYTVHEPFSGALFTLYITGSVILLVHPIWHVYRNRTAHLPDKYNEKQFPWWGWCGIILCAIAWTIAWTRFQIFSPVQRFTFTPLWLSYILIVNAASFTRTGSSLLTHNTWYLAKLFPLSAAFWWLFEYLNRYTANWYYTGSGDLPASRYIIEATLAFSTVLPAVMSTAELIKSFPGLYAGMDSYLKLKIISRPRASIMLLVFSASGLALTGIFPEILFPLLWVSPLLIITSILSLSGQETVFSGLTTGDWRTVIIYALAALLCGFFWEMWNWCSLARWTYSIPYLHGFKIFEMPLPGYAGYLPFGLECAVVAGLVNKKTNH